MTPHEHQHGAGTLAAFAALMSMSPASVDDDAIQLARAVRTALDTEETSRQWAEVSVQLANFLLEARTGGRASNVRQAAEIYEQVLQRTDDPNEAAVYAGLAHALTLDPNADAAQYERGLAMFEEAARRARERDDHGTLRVILGNHANALHQRPSGDRALALQRALDLRKEVVDLLEEPPAPEPIEIGRALHNLGGTWSEQLLGPRSQNVDQAIQALERAREYRTTQRDPAGRVRTLRALALLYPEWSRAESLTHAQQLADEAAVEADRLEAVSAAAQSARKGWGAAAGQQSALEVDLAEIGDLPKAEAAALLDRIEDNHRNVLCGIDAAEQPAVWAHWVGGLARIALERTLHLDPGFARDVFALVDLALEAVDQHDHPRLWRQLHRVAGQAADACGLWDRSLYHNRHVAAAGDRLVRATASWDGQAEELRLIRGASLFAAYAAAMTSHREIAVEQAEGARCHRLVDLAPLDVGIAGDELSSCRARVVELERQIRDEAAEPMEMVHRLVDYLGVGVDDIGITFADDAEAAERRGRRVALEQELAIVRSRIGQLVGSGASFKQLGAPEVIEVAALVQAPIVYLLPSLHGVMVLIVQPDGQVPTLHLDGLSSDLFADLLAGAGHGGFAPQYAARDMDSFEVSLERCRPVLGWMVQQVAQNLALRGFERAVLVPLGSLAILPLHAFAVGLDVLMTVVPSARILKLAACRPQHLSGARVFRVAEGPSEAKLEPLPLAAAETAWLGHAFGAVDVGDDPRRLIDVGAGTTHVHLACHGRFRPSDPLASTLYVGEDGLTLEDMMGAASASPVELVVMSACESALADRHLPDETLGFPGVLLATVARGVVAAAWPVDDAAALGWTHAFYRALFDSNLAPAAAADAAATWMREATADEVVSAFEDVADVLPRSAPAFGRLQRVARTLRDLPAGVRPFAAIRHHAAFIYIGA
jgi:CHAT domain-containing protein